MLVQEFKDQITAAATKHFKHSVVGFWGGISNDSLCVTFAATDKENSLHNIQQNSPILFHMWMHDCIDKETQEFNAEKIKMDGFKIALSIKPTSQYLAMSHDRLTVRARVNTPEKIVKCFEDSLKKAAVMWNKHIEDDTFYRKEEYSDEILNQCK